MDVFNTYKYNLRHSSNIKSRPVIKKKLTIPASLIYLNTNRFYGRNALCMRVCLNKKSLLPSKKKKKSGSKVRQGCHK